MRNAETNEMKDGRVFCTSVLKAVRYGVLTCSLQWQFDTLLPLTVSCFTIPLVPSTRQGELNDSFSDLAGQDQVVSKSGRLL